MSEYDVDPWVAEAREKKLPEQFIEGLKTSDGVTEAEKAKIVASVETAEELRRKREAAIELGRRYGEDEADRRRETGDDRSGRINRAMAYAAWEFDGRPLSSERQRAEFGVTTSEVVGSLERSLTSRLLSKEKKK